jgi:predicted nucleic acid-binding protein
LSVYFADTSAIAKRYLPEVGSGWVQSWIDPASEHVTIISALATVEFVSLLARRQREGNASQADFNRLRQDFLFHARHQYRVIAPRQGVLVQARRLVAKHPLRTLDALQLASALAAAGAIGAFPILSAEIANYWRLPPPRASSQMTQTPIPETGPGFTTRCRERLPVTIEMRIVVK